MGRTRKKNLHLPPRMRLQHGAYYYVYPAGKWERLSDDFGEAKRKWALIADPENESGTVAAMLDEYLVEVAPKKAPRTYQDNLKEAVYLKAYFGKMRPEHVLPVDVGSYLEARAKQGAPVRGNREKALLSHVFTWARTRSDAWGRVVTVNPCFGVHRNPEQKRGRIIEDVEYRKVYDLAQKPVRILMDLIYRTLQRPEDLLELGPRDVKQVDLDGEVRRVLRVYQGKMKTRSGKHVDILISPEIESILAESASDKIAGMTFVHTRRGQRYTYSGIAGMFRRYVNKAGLSDFGMYDIKGKGATDMYRSGVPLERIQLLCGHDSLTTTEIYIKARMTAPIEANNRAIKAPRRVS
jgi:integrase